MIRQFVLASASVIALTAAASAADMYRAPEGVSYKDAPVYEPLWTGFYGGVNGGYGWSNNSLSGSTSRPCTRQDYDANVPGCGYVNGVFTGTVSSSASKSFSSEGGFGGGQIGYNWQPGTGGGYKDGPARGNFVFGIEADIQGSGIEGSTTINPASGASATGKDELDWFGTIRGRVGYAFDTTLLYFTGGFAFGGVKDTVSATAGATTKTASRDGTDTGYVLGGGIEHYFNQKWSGKIEYQYIDLGSDTISTAPGSPSATLDAQHQYDTVRVGLNYHFGSTYEPLK
jgi:outer membrane immunogenic protein